jgi:tRNA U34 2-thiouridine synthase MnmA/TrmU
MQPRLAAKRLGVALAEIDISQQVLDIVKSPKHGYGSNMNPCIDCHIFMLKKAAEYMKQTDAYFLMTGEVVGERPMSQRKDMLRHIEKEAGLCGLILRPLSAKLLDITIPEKKGWVQRDKLLDIQGRGRRPQIEMAKELGITDYPQPAGGCLLTDPGFAKRIRDLLKYNQLTIENINLLKMGRHFRISDAAKAIVGRNKTENKRLLALIKDGDSVFKVLRYPGPVVLSRGQLEQQHHDILASIAARYSDAKDGPVEVESLRHPGKERLVFKVKKCGQEFLNETRV